MRALGQDPTEDELNAMVDDVDTDGSGAIEVDEFIMMMAKRSKGGYGYPTHPLDGHPLSESSSINVEHGYRW